MTEIFTVKKMEQAKKLASETFGVAEDLIVFRVIEEKKGFFGKMKVEAIYDAPVKEAPAPKAEKAAPVFQEAPAAQEEISCEKEPAAEEPIAEEEITAAEEESAVEIPAAELPEYLAAARTYIIAIYEKMGVAVDVTVSRIENGILMNVTSDSKSGTIIGRRGETLDSIQYLASIIANRGKEEYSRIMLDSNGYRTKRRKTLEQLA